MANAATGDALPPGLYIIATPIGNMGDMTARAVELLSKVDAIACEDTRETGKLAAYHGLSAPRLPYHDHNAAEMRPKITGMIEGGKSVALVSDAGMPLISDPGYKLVKACVDAGLLVTCAPGASASLTALVLSGLPSDRFFFAGFLPPKSAARKSAIDDIKTVPGTLIFYETAPRLIDSLSDMKEVLGDRPAAVARELTKKFEEVRRGKLSDLISYYNDKGEPKGEIVIIVGAPDGSGSDGWTDERIDTLLAENLADGMSVKDAAATVAMQSGRKKSDVYQRALSIKGQK